MLVALRKDGKDPMLIPAGLRGLYMRKGYTDFSACPKGVAEASEPTPWEPRTTPDEPPPAPEPPPKPKPEPAKPRQRTRRRNVVEAVDGTPSGE